MFQKQNGVNSRNPFTTNVCLQLTIYTHVSYLWSPRLILTLMSISQEQPSEEICMYCVLFLSIGITPY